MKITSFQVAGRLTNLVGKIILTTFLIWGIFGEQTRADTTLFFEDFESDLSQWTGQDEGEHTGIILDDPLEEDKALSFSELTIGGDVFTRQSFTSPTNMYRLSFDYLGLEKPESFPDNFGGFLGASLDFPGRHRWVAGTIEAYPGIFAHLRDTNQWESYTIEVTTRRSFDFHLLLEDFVFSGGVPTDVYFDNILLEAVIPDSQSIPEPSLVWGLFAFVTMGVGSKIKSQLSKPLPHCSGENGFNSSKFLF